MSELDLSREEDISNELLARDEALRTYFREYDPKTPYGINIDRWTEKFKVERGGVLDEIVHKYPILALGFGTWNEKGKVVEGTGILTASKDVLKRNWKMMVHSAYAAANVEFGVNFFNGDGNTNKVSDILTELGFHGKTFQGLSADGLRDATLVSHFWQIRSSQNYSPGIAWLHRGPDFVEYLRFLEGLKAVRPELGIAQDAEQLHTVSPYARRQMEKFGYTALVSGSDWGTSEKPISTAQFGIILADVALHGASLEYLPELNAAKTRFNDAMEAVHPGFMKEMAEAPKPPWMHEILEAYDALYTQ